jgi:DNA-binding NtrC family response regulator
LSAKAKILILDDEPIVGERLKASLERSDFIVDTFSSSHEALQRLQEESYDVLVTDLKMSGPDGLEVLRMAQQVQPRIKSVVITGFATRDTAREVMASGAVEFIAKPFKISQLRNLLLKLSDKQGTSDEPSGSITKDNAHD